MNRYPTPLSFQPDYPSPPGSSSVASTFPSQHAAPAQRIQQDKNFPHQSHANTHPARTYNAISYAKQHLAVSILQETPNPTIFAWLEGFRAFLRGEQWFNPGLLSSRQRQAVFDLKDCSDDLVLTWLNFARSSGSLNVSQIFHGNSILNHDRVAANSLAQSPSSFSDSSVYNPPKSSWEHEPYNPSRGASVGQRNSPAAISNKHDHWCFICEDPKRIRTCDGFKRHIREHDTKYYCIPQDLVAYSRDGPICASCGVSNPDPIHLNTHNAPECLGKKYTRKPFLMNHLREVHGIHDGSARADKSEHTVHKSNFACGFCASGFRSRQEQVNHIDAVHYKFSEHIHNWNSDKVIRGLLSQHMADANWRRALAANPRLLKPWFRWDPTLVGQLQERLELSEEPADILCRAAIAVESNHDRMELENVNSVHITSATGPAMDESHSIQTFEHENGLSPLLSASAQCSTTHTPWMTNPTLQLQRLAQGLHGINYRNWEAIDEDRLLPQIASETYGSPGSAMYLHADHRAQLPSSPHSGESSMQQQHSAYVPSTAPARVAPQAFGGDAGNSASSLLGGYSQGVSPIDAINPHLGQVTEAHKYPAQAHPGWLHAALAPPSARSPFLRNPPLSRSVPVTSLYNPRYHQPVAAQLSRRETTDRRGIEMDVDSDNMQRFNKDLDHTRGQSRGRRRRH